MLARQPGGFIRDLGGSGACRQGKWKAGRNRSEWEVRLGPLGTWADPSPLLELGTPSQATSPKVIAMLPTLAESALTWELGGLGSCLSSTH